MQGFASSRRALAYGAFLFLLGCGESAAPRPSEAIDHSREPAGAESHRWVEKQRLTVQGRASFGHVVAMSETTALVGNRERSIYVYTLSDGEWIAPQEVVVEGPVNQLAYGMSAAVSGDTAIIGTPGSLELASAHVITRTASGWAVSTPPLVGDPTIGDESFGAVVAVEGDLALVGAPYSESVYVFARSGDEWTRVNRLHRETASSSFGAALGISGNLVVVGAPKAGTPFEAGQAYVYTMPSDPSSMWPEPDILVADVRLDNDHFGSSVAVEGDTIAVGAIGRSPGAAFAFTKIASEWSPRELLTDRYSSGSDEFGYSIAISGARMVIGAPRLTTETNTLGGVYVLSRTGASWSEEQPIVGPRSILFFGRSVGISGDWIVVGAPSEMPSVDGAAYACRRLLDLGSACETNEECGSGHCVSNICCDAACVLECEECSTGTCEPVSVGSEGAPSSSPYLCDGSRRDRPGECVTVDDCIGTYYCTDGACTGKGTIGDACSAPNQCLSEHCLAGYCSGTQPNSSRCRDASECDEGNCVDGLCCDDPCGGQCEACDVSRREGRCTPVTGEPHGDRTPCAGVGTSCAGTCNGELSDVCDYPTDQCDSTCGENDALDGELAETVSICDGQGECVESETPRPCLEFVCDEDAVACKSSCEVDDDCAGDRSCWADGSCAPSPRCTPDGLSSETAPDGIPESCAPFVCTDGRCKTSCASPNDCAPPHACDANQECVLPAPAEAGCGCRTASRRGTPTWPLVGALALFAFARRRARRRAFELGT